ncbi:DUF7380 domain-containing protein [Gordonia sputi]|uniref:DUF7380 domain-containing protein n=1 Tax=Gordonia sputi TaxID=36823 RepID=UPI003FD7BD75
MVSSAMLNAEDWLEPFTPAMQFGGQRTVVPADMDSEQLALLARIAPLVERDDLRARVADVAWCYGDRSDIAMLDRGIDAYRAAPLTGDVWFSVGRDAWVRAFELAARRGADGQARVQEVSGALTAQILGGLPPHPALQATRAPRARGDVTDERSRTPPLKRGHTARRAP